MPALTEIGRLKRLAELFVLAMKVIPGITVEENAAVIACLMDHGLTERQAESILDDAFRRFDRGMIRTPEQTLRDIGMAFRKREHGFILEQTQAILEAGEVNDDIQAFYDLCCEHLYHM